MILCIYQTPPAPAGYPVSENVPAEAAAFIGHHRGALPQLGETFARYGQAWRIVAARPMPAIGGAGSPWTFRVRAVEATAEARDQKPETSLKG